MTLLPNVRLNSALDSKVEFVEESKSGNTTAFVWDQPHSTAIKNISAIIGFMELPLLYPKIDLKASCRLLISRPLKSLLLLKARRHVTR